ncbi:O-acetyl-ADP-ribose deacetylase [Flagellimonas meishanensis]|uniref:O-acetyl-ADP-ribose deacetylase n=1 Tax=Flagellimonas meishanensis TaxID=2873264 RepID=UPI001CA7444E|nr:O-acetyl-ADP-ribose deacetylase [[Muricauda] meishanensis]
MNIELKKGDITKLNVDAIVNAANTSLLGGGGVDGAIHRAGGNAILKECEQIRDKQGGCKIGEAVITSGGNLPCKYVIHTVGPKWNDGKSNEEELLRLSYVNSLRLALKYGLKTIAFPNISTGIFGFPKEKAAQIAIKVVRELMKTPGKIDELTFICFDNENYAIYKKIMESLNPKK